MLSVFHAIRVPNSVCLGSVSPSPYEVTRHRPNSEQRIAPEALAPNPNPRDATDLATKEMQKKVSGTFLPEWLRRILLQKGS
jgi:hypothetical protein